jgi:hypothetical protein
MRDSYVEEIANQNGPESCVYVGNCVCEALTGGDVGQVLSRENMRIRGADVVDGSGRPHRPDRYREIGEGPARSETLSMHPNISCGSREIPCSIGAGTPIRTGNSKEVIRR